MLTKERIKVISIIIMILVVGFLLRIDSANLHGISVENRTYYQGPNNLPYMYCMDSYYNYRLTANYLDHGYLGDTIINGTNWDLYSYFPEGRSAEYPPLIVYLTAYIYKLINLFSNVPLLTLCFWLPAFIGPLAGVPAYFLVKKVTNDYGGLGAGVLAVTAPMYFVRTVPGWFDTDMFNMLFPLLTAWFLIEALDGQNNLKRGTLFAFLSAFSLFLFSVSWQGWIYLFYVVILSIIVYIALCKLRNLKIENFYPLSLFLTLFFLLGISNLGALFLPYEFIIANNSNLWPNIFISVSELETPSIEYVISWTGIAFLTGIFGFIWIFRSLINKNFKKRFLGNMNWFYFILIIIWSLAGFYSVMKGTRFILLLIPPLIISSGILLGISTQYIDKLERFRIFKRRKYLTTFLSICILLLVLSPAVISAHRTSSFLIPLADDDLWNASEWIYKNTPGDTVIISDWSYGHFFTAIANRPVSIDGGSFNTPRAYWIDRAFATSNESLSSGIFRMLATSGDKGYLTLNNYTDNTIKTVEILNNILGVERGTAEKKLTTKYNLSEKQAENVLKYTHPDNPHPYVVVTSNSRISTGYWIFYFGMWDFNSQKGMNSSYSYGRIVEENGLLRTDNGISYLNGDVTWNNKTPYSVVKIFDGKIERRYLDKNSDFSIYLLMEDKEAVVIDREFKNSLFTRLVIEKSNATQFKPIYKTKNIVVWKVE
ncbi:MAG: STT3 domain-containing protein [Methanobacterium sp.]|jgi:dolichyl-diphosphooligosaccharide--protein glycosyltransferase